MDWTRIADDWADMTRRLSNSALPASDTRQAPEERDVALAMPRAEISAEAMAPTETGTAHRSTDT